MKVAAQRWKQRSCGEGGWGLMLASGWMLLSRAKTQRTLSFSYEGLRPLASQIGRRPRSRHAGRESHRTGIAEPLRTSSAHLSAAIRICLDFISSLVERCFWVDLLCLGTANSGLFARTKRAKMPKRGSNKQKSITLNTLAVKSKRILCESLAFSTHRHWNLRVLCGLCARQVTSRKYRISPNRFAFIFTIYE